MDQTKLICEMIAGAVGGLAIFLLGMKYMSDGMQAVAGNRLRRMICAVTDNRFLGLATGAGVTALIQSSSVTTVMLVGMVNAGVMTLTQAIGVILGADIGTTITAWIVSLNVLDYGLVILGVSGFFFLFTRSDKVRNISMMVMGIGMVFFGLHVMKEGLEPVQSMPEFKDLFSKFAPTNTLGVLKCAFIGALVTAVVQSSSATVAITIMLARTDVIGYDTAVALVLGQNIGTTITAYLASLGTATPAKRVAYAHVLSKTVGAVIMVCLFFPYMTLLKWLTPETMDIAKRIAVSHSLFNCALVCMFLPLRTVLAQTLLKLFPDKPKKEKPRLTALDVRLMDSPVFGIEQSSQEVCKMGTNISEMLTLTRELVQQNEPDEEQIRKVFHREEMLDEMQKEIVEFITHLLEGNVSRDLMDQTRSQLRIADEYESISDYVVTILKLDLKLRKDGFPLDAQELEDVLKLHDRITELVDLLNEAVKSGVGCELSEIRTSGELIDRAMKGFRRAYLERMEEVHLPPLKSVLYVDMLQGYRKIKDHGINVAEALSGEK